MDDQHRQQLHRARMLDDGVYWQDVPEGKVTKAARYAGYCLGAFIVLLALAGAMHSIGVISG